jgi:hypothetical protein
MSKHTCILVSAVAVLAAILAAQAVARDAAKGQAVTVATGKFAHRSWSLAVQGQHHQRCYELSLEGRSSASTSATCRSDRRRPPKWTRLMGISDQNDSATVELDVTQKRVRSMRLRIGHPRSDRPSEWIHVRNRRITRPQAHKASVKRDFRFAVLHSRGTLCVKKVILFNRQDDRIYKLRVPCEF